MSNLNIINSSDTTKNTISTIITPTSFYIHKTIFCPVDELVFADFINFVIFPLLFSSLCSIIQIGNK